MLNPAIQKQLFNSDGTLRDHRRQNKEILPGQRLVIPVYSNESTEPMAYWKFFPQFPGKQVLATALEQQITGNGLKFIIGKIYLAEQGSKKGIPVLISEPAGVDLQSLAKKDMEQSQVPLKNFQASLNPRVFGLKFLESLLCGYEDHQLANIADKIEYLIGIDSDHVFHDPVLEEFFLKIRSTISCKGTEVDF